MQPTLQHDSSIPLQNVRRIGFIENRSVETQTQDPYINEERNDKRTIKTGLVVILGILLIACIAGVLTWFLTKKGDYFFCVFKIFIDIFVTNLEDVFPLPFLLTNCMFYLQEMMNFLSNIVSFIFYIFM